MKKITNPLITTLSLLLVLFSISSAAESLPPHLVKWAHANPIISIGVDSSFPPFDYVDEKGDTAGAGKLIRQQLSDILPVDLQEASISDFRQEYESVLQGNIDAISVCGNIAQRQGEVLFSKPFMQMTPIVVVKENGDIQAENDISSTSKISSISGYADEAFAKQLSANTINVNNNIQGYKSVVEGQADGFITYLYLYRYMQKKYGFENLKPIAISAFESLPLGFCVNKNKPEIVEILNWGIDKLDNDFILATQGEWAEIDSSHDKGLKNKDSSSLLKVIVFAIILIFIVLILAKNLASSIAIKLDTTGFRVTYFTTLIVILVFAGLAIQLFLNNYKEQIIQDQQETFNVTRDVTKKTIEGWYKERELLANNIANSKAFGPLVNNLVLAIEKQDPQLTLQAKKVLREYFAKRPYTTQNGRAYTISDIQGNYILNLVERVEGEASTIISQRPMLFEKVVSGQSMFIPPVWASVNIDNNNAKTDKDAEVFIATPVRNNDNEIIAVLAFRFDPNREFSQLFIDGRLGQSFESYAIDSDGYMISSSRFTLDLQRNGMVPLGESSVLNIRLKDAANNPIVQAAKFQHSGLNLEGYQNYRGKSVVGQWVNFKEYNFTVVSEIELSEMMAEYNDVRTLLFIGLVISSAFILSLSIFMITISNRANEISRRSQKELSEQVQARTKELSDSELINKLINNSVADGILGIDKQGGFTFVNESACKLLGYSESEILESDVMSLFSETDTEIKSFEETMIYQIMGSEEVVRVDNEALILSNGNSFPAGYSISPVNNEASELAAVVTFQDITERIQESERVEKMLENLPACMVIMSQDDRVEKINQTGVELLGWQRDEIIGQPVDVFIPDEQVDSHKALLAKFFAEEVVIDTQTLERDFRVKHKSGKLIDIQAVYTPVRFYDGLFAVVMVRDITTEKQAEHALIEAKQLADDASKSKSDFLANMSHEIRTPMNAIMGMSHLALTCELDRKPHNYVTKVYKAAESLLGIINDILDFSKIEAGKLDIEVIEFNLHDSFADLANIISLKAGEKGLELLFDISSNVPLILKGDPLRLNQILINLASNAVKFTEKGQIVISVSIVKNDSADADDIILEFSVKDSGIGMSEEQQGKLFKSFSQADSSITRKYGGTGLGLTISKRLVELMQGNIWLDSVEGQGSCFSFTTHLKTSANNETHVSEQQKSFLEGKRILIVDDNQLALDVLSSILTSFNCHVVIASSGRKAIELANQATIAFDFVMLDWKMPELDGIETYQIIKSQNNYQDNQFILVTSNANDVETVEQLKNSIGSVLVKPVTSSSIFDELMHLSGEEAFTVTREMKRDDTLLENQQSLQGAKILLVEDNELNQELAIELLKESGINVELAENGAIAVEMVTRNSYDGILMDLQMPVMDGFSATKIIRNSDKKLPIIAMTANAMVSDKEKVIAAGMNDHITKPINVNDMFATIARWIIPSQPLKSLGHSKHVSLVNTDEIEIADFISIDKAAGLQVANGNKALYVKLLGRFIKGQNDFVERFTASIARQDKEESTRFVHTLKGSAGNIGAKLLQASAEPLERACTQVDSVSESEIESLLTNTEGELNKVLNELSAYLVQIESDSNENNTTDFIFTDKMKQQLAELLTLVEDFETEALDLAQEIIEQLKGSKEELIFQNIYQQIEGYEFSEAEVSLNDFMQRFEKG